MLLGLAVLAPATAAGAVGGSPSPSYDVSASTSAAPDPLGVYFRDDAVGRAQLALVTTACGTERWTVKTGADDDRHRVSPTVHHVSIRYLRHRATPASKPPASRVGPVETRTWQVRAWLKEYVREDDGDYHLVLADGHGRTMVAEIPQPACVAGISPFKSAIRTAREHMDRHFRVTTDFKTTRTRVVVRGIGFFDFLHGQTGMAPNGLELHPVVRLRFP